MEEKRKKIGIELLPSLKKRLKQRAIDTDRPMWQITEDAITQYLDGAKAQPPEDPDLTKARYVFEHGEESDVEGLRTNISAFHRLAASNPRSGGKGRRKRIG